MQTNQKRGFRVCHNSKQIKSDVAVNVLFQNLTKNAWLDLLSHKILLNGNGKL